MKRCERHLGGAHEIQIVLIGPVHVRLVGREEAGSEHHFLANEHGRDDRGEALRLKNVHGIAHQRELHLDDVAEQVGEPRSARPDRPLDVEHAERGSDLDVILGLEVEGRRLLVVAPDLDGVLVGQAVGSAGIRKVRRRRQQQCERRLGVAQLRLQLLQLGTDVRDLFDQPLLLVALGAADRLRRLVLLRAKLLDLLGQPSAGLVGGQQLVDALGKASAREAGAESFGVLPDLLDVEHAVVTPLRDRIPPRTLWPRRPIAARPERGRNPMRRPRP